MSPDEIAARPDWTAKRAALAERWTEHSPMTPFEMGGAVKRDAAWDVPDYDGEAQFGSAQYDRRGLLNVVARLLDERDTLRAALEKIAGGGDFTSSDYRRELDLAMRIAAAALSESPEGETA